MQSSVLKNYRHSNGFTIVEILVVVVILALLTTLGAVGYTSVQKYTRDQKRTGDVTLIKNELANYYRENGEYPLYSHQSTPFLSQTAWNFLDKRQIQDPLDLVGSNAADGSRLDSGLCAKETHAFNNCPNYGYLTTPSTSGLQGADFWTEATTYLSPITACKIAVQTKRVEPSGSYPNPWYVLSWYNETADTINYSASNANDVTISGTDKKTGKSCVWQNL